MATRAQMLAIEDYGSIREQECAPVASRKNCCIVMVTSSWEANNVQLR